MFCANVKKMVAILSIAMLSATSVVGCGADAKEESKNVDKGTEAAEEIFTKGVYVNYAAEAENPEKTYFYVFFGDGSGSIEDGVANTANYFECEQKEDSVTFHIGSIDPIDEEFKVISCENGIVKGSFDDGIELVFEPVEGVDVDTFSAVNYVNEANGEHFVYTDANGWSVHYNPELIQVNEGGPITTFVFTGESAGTNMITVTYTVDDNAEGIIKTLGEPYGDAVTYSEGTFPGTEDVKSYWVQSAPSTDGSGLYMTAVARDYMDGALVFEFTEHMGEDEEQNYLVSDTLAEIIDSIEFLDYEE
ncbi:hypothetical protein [Pseudobutyrivibrio sp. MD2005]|uniref:hypothetical protein n=1 Tax=Pseudobutyrivibrio sp. MD2005 TaxID=1410616 RepID=UPI000480FFF5|nr:hypothetical protein [Pseudobutyrivibrio sp. MD2005]